jgi:hypothetical protein
MLVNNGLLILKENFSTNSEPSATCVNTNGETTSVNVRLKTNNIYSLLLGYSGSANASTMLYSSLYYLSNNNTVYYGANSTSGGAMFGIKLGDGNTPVALTDYNLSGNIITTFTATTALSCDIENGHLVIRATYTITNTSSSPFTIREIGNFRVNTTSQTGSVMTSRDVLETPLTIAGNSTGVLVYSVTI